MKSRNDSLSSLQFKSLALMNSWFLFYFRNITFIVLHFKLHRRKRLFVDMFSILSTAHTSPGGLYVECIECYSQVIQKSIKFEISFHPPVRRSTKYLILCFSLYMYQFKSWPGMPPNYFHNKLWKKRIGKHYKVKSILHKNIIDTKE